MPKAHQRYANMTPASLIGKADQIGVNTAILIERLMRDRPHPEQGYRSAMGVLSLARRYDRDRVEASCERALIINAVSTLRSPRSSNPGSTGSGRQPSRHDPRLFDALALARLDGSFPRLADRLARVELDLPR